MPFSTWVTSNSSSKRRQCSWCLHNVFEGTFLRSCGKSLKLDPDAINRMKEALEILKAPFRASPISTRGAKCGPNLWQLHHTKARDAFRGATEGERGFTSIWKMMRLTGNLSLSKIGRMLVFDIWITLYNSVFSTKRRKQRERNVHILFSRSVDKNRQAPLLSQRPRYWEAKELSRNLQTEKRELTTSFFPNW